MPLPMLQQFSDVLDEVGGGGGAHPRAAHCAGQHSCLRTAVTSCRCSTSSCAPRSLRPASACDRQCRPPAGCVTHEHPTPRAPWLLLATLLQENPDLFKWLTGQLEEPERLQKNPAYQVPASCGQEGRRQGCLGCGSTVCRCARRVRVAAARLPAVPEDWRRGLSASHGTRRVQQPQRQVFPSACRPCGPTCPLRWRRMPSLPAWQPRARSGCAAGTIPGGEAAARAPSRVATQESAPRLGAGSTDVTSEPCAWGPGGGGVEER